MQDIEDRERTYRVTLQRAEYLHLTIDVTARNSSSARATARSQSAGVSAEKWERIGRTVQPFGNPEVVKVDLISGGSLGDRVVEDLLYDPEKDEVSDQVGNALNRMTATDLRDLIDRAHQEWINGGGAS